MRKWRKPLIFTDEAMARVPALVEQGMSARQIAKLLGGTESSLRVKACQYNISLRRPRYSYTRRKGSISRSVLVSVDTLTKLKPHADAIDVSDQELAGMLLDIIVRDGLVDAVLDHPKALDEQEAA